MSGAGIEQAFTKVNKSKPGFYIWRIEKLKVVPVPKDKYGSFFTGDSYIILSIKELKGHSALDMHIHFWLGNKTSQDEAGVAAYKTVELDDMLKGAPVQHREMQNNESNTFLNYFKPVGGIIYQEGGVASGFNHVEEKFTEKLWKVKGKHNVRVSQLEEISWSQMNDGDVFILEIPGTGVYLWNGKKANRREKMQGCTVARKIKDKHSKVLKNIYIIDSGREADDLTKEELAKFEAHLPLSKKAAELQSIEEAGSDEQADQEVGLIKLYLCKEEDNKVKVTEVKTGPLKHSDLDQTDAFIIDAGKVIWFWKGKEASDKERKDGMNMAMVYVQKKSMPRCTQVAKVIQGAEPPEFQSLFADWPAPKYSGNSYNKNKIAKTVQTKFDASTLHSNPKLAAETQMVDDGTGRVEVWRVEDHELVPIAKKYFGEFFGGDCYVILYSYKAGGSERHIIYFWLGVHSSQTERGTAALCAMRKDDELGGVATQVRVTQGKEPDHFVAMFDGKMIVFEGGKSSAVGDYKREDKYLLQVHGTAFNCPKAVQVGMRSKNLNTNDMFIVITKKSVIIWNSKMSTGDEREMAKKIASKFNHQHQMVVEGSERDDFWALFEEGKEEYNREPERSKEAENKPVRMFEVSNATGRVVATEVDSTPFTQEDLDVDDVMLIDTWDRIFIWIGVGSNKAEQEGAWNIADEYLKADPAGRDSKTPIVILKQGNEASDFIGFFSTWDYEYWGKCKSYEEMKKDARENNTPLEQQLNTAVTNGADFGTVDKYPLAQLQGPADELPENVSPDRREMHLELEEFKKCFGCDYAGFQALANWKQVDLKKKNKLF